MTENIETPSPHGPAPAPNGSGGDPPARNREKALNLPPVTFALLLMFMAIHVIRAVSPVIGERWANQWGFLPAAFTVQPFAQSFTLLSYGLLHFGWLHFFMNMTGFMAFGSGVERLFGRVWLLAILLGGTLVGALGHWALEPHSMVLMGGASAGISALFGAVLPLIATGRNYKVAVITFVLMNIALGFVGMPSQPGIAIAWQAHLFGFAFGLLAAHLRLRSLTAERADQFN